MNHHHVGSLNNRLPPILRLCFEPFLDTGLPLPSHCVSKIKRVTFLTFSESLHSILSQKNSECELFWRRNVQNFFSEVNFLYGETLNRCIIRVYSLKSFPKLSVNIKSTDNLFHVILNFPVNTCFAVKKNGKLSSEYASK